MTETVKPAWRLGPAREPLDRDVSKRIDVLRIILIGLIVLAHGARGITVRIAGETAPGAAIMLDILNGHVDFVAVPLFFTISGFLFLRKFELSLAAYGEMLQKKFASVLVPYILFNVGLVAWFYCVGSIEMLGSWNFVLSEGLVAKTLGLGTTPINYPLWFLRDLLVVFLVSPIFLVFFKEAPGVGLVTFFCLWTGLSEGPYSYGGDMFAFYLGGYLARCRLPLAGVSWWQRAGTWIFCLLTIVLICSSSLGLTDEAVRQFLFKANLVFGIIAFWRFSAIACIRDSKVLARMGRHSFFVYLAHEPTISMLQTRLLAVWRPVGNVQQIVFYLGSGLTTIVGLWLLAELLSRFAPMVYNFATGARTRPGRAPGARVPAGSS
ncbi:acyltransferase family protein [Desulfovibrio sp. TomC]|uniref:acyltransferase family protein n=1 Tax=Desulfovibrio sp. TomC TaxID=1562888 RepID=UPI0005755380|nr:acyltransferase [Desulfovibrio sp. TomC]KHK04176.1 Succinoglycan biosynthesis protein [Desulfovibrio sp. TomC]